jgi:hypothetical protein
MGIFGDLGPKFIDFNTQAEVLLDHWVEVSDNTDDRIIVHESELSGERYFINRGSFRDIEGKVHLFKYPNPLNKFEEIYRYRHRFVIFHLHRDRDPFKDFYGEPVLFYIESIIPQNLTTLDYRDVLYIKFRALRTLDLTKSTRQTIVDDLFNEVMDDSSKVIDNKG